MYEERDISNWEILKQMGYTLQKCQWSEDKAEELFQLQYVIMDWI